ncbi:hypothetical protein PBI_SCTP2_410 [Salicola phage SCTP-2]|nr:hypothetical protein PBI_SCTP2_410 [Salicola phage SCTP-2]
MRISQLLKEHTDVYNDTEFSQDFLSDVCEKLNSDFSEAWNIVRNNNLQHAIFRADAEVVYEVAVAFKNADSERKAAYALLNIHNLWINNHPDWSEFPKRNVICSTNAEDISDRRGETCVVIPKNGSKIGLCPESDIYDSFVKINDMIDESMPLNMFYDDVQRNIVENLRVFSTLSGIKIQTLKHGMSYSETRKTLEQYDELLNHIKNNPEFYKNKDVDSYIVSQFQYSIYEYIILRREAMMPTHVRYILNNGFIKSFDELFEPENFQVLDYKTAIQNDEPLECWIDQPCILMTFEAYDIIKEYYERNYGDD